MSWSTYGKQRSQSTLKVGSAVTDFDMPPLKIEIPKLFTISEPAVFMRRSEPSDRDFDKMRDPIRKYFHRFFECNPHFAFVVSDRDLTEGVRFRFRVPYKGKPAGWGDDAPEVTGTSEYQIELKICYRENDKKPPQDGFKFVAGRSQGVPDEVWIYQMVVHENIDYDGGGGTEHDVCQLYYAGDLQDEFYNDIYNKLGKDIGTQVIWNFCKEIFEHRGEVVIDPEQFTQRFYKEKINPNEGIEQSL